MYTLTLQNELILLKSMNNSQLPKVFQQAICVAREFSIEYLWIDSLCILQGSESDWLAQSVRMDDIYANSYSNIAATSAKDGREGLFCERNPLLSIFCQSSGIRICVDSHRSFRAYFPRSLIKDVSSGQVQYHIIECDIFGTGIKDSPLLGCAWVLREGLLILYFGARQLLFECNNHYRCQSFPQGLHGRARESAIWKSGTPDFGRIITIPSRWATDPWRVAWMNLIPTYSRGNWTFARDKLVAIHSITIRMNSDKNGKYIA